MINISLNPQHTAIVWQFDGQWDVSILQNAFLEYWLLTDSIEYALPVVIDFQQSTAPQNVISAMGSILQALAHNTECVIIVGSVPNWKSVYALVTYTMDALPISVEFVETQDEAQKLLSLISPADAKAEITTR